MVDMAGLGAVERFTPNRAGLRAILASEQLLPGLRAAARPIAATADRLAPPGMSGSARVEDGTSFQKRARVWVVADRKGAAYVAAKTNWLQAAVDLHSKVVNRW